MGSHHFLQSVHNRRQPDREGSATRFACHGNIAAHHLTEASASTPAFLAIGSTRSGLIVLQFEQEIGVNTEARRKIWHSRRVIKPISAGSLGSASFTLPESRCVAQTQSRQNSSVRSIIS
jgi:hypothetical protein